MSEGLFKKRLQEVTHCESGFSKIYLETALDLVNEARKDIFSAIHVEQGNGIRRRDIDTIKLFAALDKWFGEEKKK